MSTDSKNPTTDGTRRSIVASLAALGVTAPWLAGSRVSRDEPITLRYTSHISRTHGMFTEGFVPFAALVEKETQGRLRLQAFTDQLLHGPSDGFKAAVSGITDYTHSYIAYQPGSFKLLHAPQLPFLFPSPQVASLVVEELYPKYFKTEFERMGVYLAHVDCTSHYNIISRKPIRRLEDLRGIKIRAPGGPVAEIFLELGAVPVAITVAEMYVALQRGTIDAVAAAGPDMVSYRLHEIATYYTEVDINLLGLQFCLNRRAFDSLPADLRETLYALFRVRSQMVVQNYYNGRGLERAQNTMRDAGVQTIALDDDERLRWRAAVEPVIYRFVQRNESEGLPARKLILDMQRLSKEFGSLSNEAINQRVRNSPALGIISL